ncbi:hypothetical protein QVD17_15239 [Tagetes erecta]|uniref:Uncharacterized protein n=1 Tax=Tagetes erecta TaxID=13708 RepID=A0AAD8KS09_TARER|nr:hypothetical protein QVD17_15239 [Tagetes erecta]
MFSHPNMAMDMLKKNLFGLRGLFSLILGEENAWVLAQMFSDPNMAKDMMKKNLFGLRGLFSLILGEENAWLVT